MLFSLSLYSSICLLTLLTSCEVSVKVSPGLRRFQTRPDAPDFSLGASKKKRKKRKPETNLKKRGPKQISNTWVCFPGVLVNIKVTLKLDLWPKSLQSSFWVLAAEFTFGSEIGKPEEKYEVFNILNLISSWFKHPALDTPLSLYSPAMSLSLPLHMNGHPADSARLLPADRWICISSEQRSGSANGEPRRCLSLEAARPIRVMSVREEAGFIGGGWEGERAAPHFPFCWISARNWLNVVKYDIVIQRRTVC